jgi:hypothetical protein
MSNLETLCHSDHLVETAKLHRSRGRTRRGMP